MSLESALWRYLCEQPSLSAQLGSRIYRETAPSDRAQEFPYLTYGQSGENPEHYLMGFANITNARVVMDIWCETTQQRDTLAALLQSLVPSWAGTQRDNVAIRSALIVEQVDSFVPPTDGSERGVYQRSLDVDIWYRDV